VPGILNNWMLCEDAIENRADQQNAKSIEQANRGHQCDRREKLPPIRSGVAQQTV
jgi:hypothetical protein